MRPFRPLVALSALVLLAACGTGSGPDGTAASGTSSRTSTPPTSTSTSGTATPTETSSPSSSPSGRVRLMTVTGSVSEGVEAGCLLLTPSPKDSNGSWRLVGKIDGIQPGQQVTVRGYRLEGIASTCQQGRPFHVDEVLTG